MIPSLLSHPEAETAVHPPDSWLPAFAMWLVSFISYVDRNTLAILAPVILRDTHLNAEQYGFIISCFSVAYMIGNPVWGRLLDRFGVRGGMTAAVGAWSLAAGAHAWAGGFLSFGILRALLGAGEGPPSPAACAPSPSRCRPPNAAEDSPSPTAAARSAP